MNWSRSERGQTNRCVPTMPSMTTCATCIPCGWNSLAIHCDNALSANFPQPDDDRYMEIKSYKFIIKIHETNLFNSPIHSHNIYIVQKTQQCRSEKRSSRWTESSPSLFPPSPAPPAIPIPAHATNIHYYISKLKTLIYEKTTPPMLSKGAH